jgi:sialate O-acetylesterase
MLGDVFLCSGQSNMELGVSRTLNAASEIAASPNDTIRLLPISQDFGPSPREHFATPVSWTIAGPETVGSFSATCYYFARELQKSVKVPIGLIHASWGGSNIETWISASGLKSVGGFDERLDMLREYAKDPTSATARLGTAWEAWWRKLAPGPEGSEPWQPSATSGWINTPAKLGDWKRWGVPELSDHDGMVWYRRAVSLTAAQVGGAASLSLGGIDEVDETWVNGKPIGNTFGWGTERTYPIPAGVLHEGINVIVVNVLSTWASGGLLGPADHMTLQTADGSSVPLGGSWQYQVPPAIEGPSPRAPWESVGGLTTLYNAMIAPLGPISLRAAVWYQGETNAAVADQYEKLLTGLMADWRGRFSADLPFLIVQLPNFGAPVAGAPAESDWANLREAQRRAVTRDARAALAVTIDIGDRFELHPPNKQQVGVRLARAARHVVYGEPVTASGPRPSTIERAGDRLIVTFVDVDRALVVYSGTDPNAFEVCGDTADSCRFANAAIDGTRVTIAVPPGANVTRVRYCWGDAPICTLYDQSGLPAGPFELRVANP